MTKRVISKSGVQALVMWAVGALAPVLWLASMGVGAMIRGEKVPFGEMFCLMLAPILLLCTWVAVGTVVRSGRNRLQSASSNR